MRGVGYLVGAATRLYYLVHSHRRDDRETGNPRGSRNRLGVFAEREMVSKTESGVWEVPLLPTAAHRSSGGRVFREAHNTYICNAFSLFGSI